MSDFSDFGRYLSAQRELRGLSREHVAKATRIPPTLVAALEDGEAERLPERVFVINYVRAYAQAVGLSPDDALNRFHEIPEAMPREELSPKELELHRRRRAMKVLVGVLVLVAVCGLALWWWTNAAKTSGLHPP